jgi:hypothetical protein
MSISLPTPIQTSLTRWHAMIASRDLSALPDIIHPDAVFRSPVAPAGYLVEHGLRGIF